MRRIGIDVGGTNTDAVLIGQGGVEHSIKTPTMPDVSSGVVASIRALAKKASALDHVSGVMIGTTHFINAVVQRRELARVGAIRLGSPATDAMPPFCDWPTDLAALVNGGVWLIEGGRDYDGRPFLPLDRAALRKAAREIQARGITSIAISGMFSPLDPTEELEAADIVREIVPDAQITCSHSLGRIGLIERENAALLNAALIDLARKTIGAFTSAIAEAGISAPLYITQNDGTVFDGERAKSLPVYSFASGATNSMRGAAFLSKIDNAVVADVGGTTTDFGVIRNGFPREANAVVHVGGVRTLFRMPEVSSIGLGGGSLVDMAAVKIGPDSVGYRLTTEAIVMGGSTLTMSDIAVAAGLFDLGDRSRVAHIEQRSIEAVLGAARRMLAYNIDRVKGSAEPVPLIAVGGGSVLIPDGLEGVETVIRVEHGECANAVGAAIAQVSGEVDRVFQGVDRKEALAEAIRLANLSAVDSGADADSLQTIESEDIPIAYLPGNALRVRVRVVGDIAAGSDTVTKSQEDLQCQFAS